MNRLFGLFLFVCFGVCQTEAFDDMDLLVKEYRQILDKKYVLLPHEEIYLLPYTYNDNPNKDIYTDVVGHGNIEERGDFTQREEVEFQFSFSVLLNRNIFNSDLNLFLGYTHTSWWQIYNTGWSRQFRETNYTPSVFVRKIFERPKKISRFNILAYDIGYIHQSNGQIQELSRSWDRLFFRTAFGVNRFVFVINT